MPQKKQTDDEVFETLEHRLEITKDTPQGKGDNVELDESDEVVLEDIYKPTDDSEVTS